MRPSVARPERKQPPPKPRRVLVRHPSATSDTPTASFTHGAIGYAIQTTCVNSVPRERVAVLTRQNSSAGARPPRCFFLVFFFSPSLPDPTSSPCLKKTVSNANPGPPRCYLFRFGTRVMPSGRVG